MRTLPGFGIPKKYAEGGSIEAGSTVQPRGSILIVELNESDRAVLEPLLAEHGYSRHFAGSESKAAALIAKLDPDLVLLSSNGPAESSAEFLTALKSEEATRHIGVIMIAPTAQSAEVAEWIRRGADDFVTMPPTTEILIARINGLIDRKRIADHARELQARLEGYENSLEQKIQAVSQSQQGAIFAISKLAESRDPETGAHLDRMREYCAALARSLRAMGLFEDELTDTFLHDIYAASPLHDVGKVGISDQILLKPGKLTDAEFEIMKSHTLIGANSLREVDAEYPGSSFVRTGIEIAEYHHEKWDGTGYPHGAAGTEIPLAARILSLADVYDALTSRRCYKEALPHEKSRDIIVECKNRHFQPEVVEAFLHAESEFVRIQADLRDA